MLLSSVIIVLREVLEAALLFSVLLALTNRLALTLKWAGWSLVGGIVGAALYAINVDNVSEWLDGVGQEVVNGSLQLGIYTLTLIFLVLLAYRISKGNQCCAFTISTVMAVAVSLALTREGFEVIIYLYSTMSEKQHMPAVVMGAIIGTSIGISVGIIFYYMLRNLTASLSVNTGVFLLVMVAAGMSSQASLLFIQADILPSQLPLWDTGEWLSETSVTGQLLYALAGYESTPTAIQAGFYFGGLSLLAVSYLITRALSAPEKIHNSSEKGKA
jgi:high-affinity iron transporter